MIDITRLSGRLTPKSDAEDVLRLRVGLVDALNSDGTIDVLLDQVLVDKPVPVLAGALVEVGLPVQLLSYRGSLLAIGTSINALAPLVDKPMVRLVAQSAQSISHNTAATVQYGTGSEEIDTNGFHSESSNNTRITPTVPGIYAARVTYATGGRSDYTWIQTGVLRNGSAMAPWVRVGPNTNNTVRGVSAEALVQMNGTSDYVEHHVQQVNGASAAQNTNASSQYSCVFELEYKRPI